MVSILIYEIVNSRNFPEIAWRLIPNCMGSLMNCLAVKHCTAKRCKFYNIFLGSLMNCLAVMNFRQSTRVCWLALVILCMFWHVSDREKHGLVPRRWSGVDFHWLTCNGLCNRMEQCTWALGLNVWYLCLRFEMGYRELDIGIADQCD